MRNFQENRRWKNIAESRPVLLLLAILIIVFIWNLIGFIKKMQLTKENREIVEYKIAELEKGKEKLSSDIAKLQTEEGVEENIREKFGLAKEGEGMIVIVEDKNQPEIPLETNTSGFFSFFKNLFK